MNEKTNNLDFLPNKALFSVREAAEILGIHYITLYRMTESKEIPCVRVRRRVFISRNYIESVANGLISNIGEGN
jgi:excisionase family DNA binding protein